MQHTCINKNNQSCSHCFFCKSSGNLQIDGLNKSNLEQQKLKQGGSVGNEETNLNSKTRIF